MWERHPPASHLNARHLNNSRSSSCDLARLLQWDVQGGVLSGLFLLATITALIAVWGLYREERSD
jgi:hypothetical protein